MAKKLYVRFSTSKDEQDIFDFYKQNEHEFVAKRDDSIWKERIASGAVTLIQDEDGKIVASSISYPITVTNDKGEEIHKWTEIGSTRVALDGIGLFKTLLSAQMVRAYLLEPPEDRFGAEIIIGNEHSKHVFLKHGATPFDIPDDMRKKVIDSLKPESRDIVVEWFQLGVETIPQFAKNLLDAEKSPKVVHKATGQEYELDFSKCVLMTTFRDNLESAAGMDYGDVKKPNLSHGIKSFRDKFHP